MAERIGILCASDTELAPFLGRLENARTTERSMVALHQGLINGVEVVCAYSGVCKVNAAIAAQAVLELGVDALINAGVAGGLDPAVRLFDTVIATESVYHDVAEDILTQFHPWLASPRFPSDPALLALSRKAGARLEKRYALRWGQMATGEAFIHQQGRQEILERWAPLTVDMETAAMAHVCYVNKTPFIAIRAVSDTADHSGAAHFEANCEKASAIAADVTLALLEELHNTL